MKTKVISCTLIIASLYYMVAEFISAIYFNFSLYQTYFLHTISELGIPDISQFSWLMNSGFVVIGLALSFSNFYKFNEFIVKNKVIFYILTLITSVGVIIVAIIHGGNPVVATYHGMGATMAIVGGNLLLVVISKSMPQFETYQKVTLILGSLGLFSFAVMIIFYTNPLLMPIFERISVYTMIFWCFLTGITLAKR